MSKIKLQSSDGFTIETDVELAKCSRTIRTMLENCDTDTDDSEDAVVPLPNVRAAILHKVLQYAKMHKGECQATGEDAIRVNQRTEEMEKFDTDFVRVDQGELFELILAANYLDIKGMLVLTCRTVANMIKGKTPEEIRKQFNISKDLTPHEREQMQGQENE